MSEAMVRDLVQSGLDPKDLDARPVDSPERNAVNIPAAVEGYVIPYFKIDGSRLPFYRLKLFDYLPKYKQPKNTSNHLYFPPNFREVLEANAALGKKYIIMTEGEKKAAVACRYGFPAVGSTGVDSWRNKTMVLPQGTELIPGAKEGSIVVKLKDPSTVEDSEYAKGFEDLVALMVEGKYTLIIAYDTDDGKIKFEVQRASALLGYELRHLGISTTNIRQLALPALKGLSKVGLDDFIVAKGHKALQELVDKTMTVRSAFPRHPNVKDYVNKKLQANRLSRRDAQKVAISILTELDAGGMRLKNSDGSTMFYFDETSRTLTKITMAMFDRDMVDTGPFGNMLFDRFGLGKLDRPVMGWLAQLIPTEEPVITVSPRKIVYADRNANAVNYQINDGQYIRITSNADEPAEVKDNGSGGMLFESGQVTPIDASLILEEVENQRAAWEAKADNGKPLEPPCWWKNVLWDTRLLGKENPFHLKALSLLFYLSPWLNRWRGTQLPVELIVGESGSGKSTLMSLRLNTLIGRPDLRNAPSDLRDWHSSVVNSGGLHVTDNVQFTDKQLRQRLSDEICRIVTEPDPHIEMRRLYSTAELARFPVDCVFSFTAITQPFPNADLINRSILLELDKASGVTDEGLGKAIEYGSAWEANHLNHNGRYPTRQHARAAWIAHHALFLSRFFKLVEEEWHQSYRAKHRLINFEQIMVLGAKVFGWDQNGSYDWLVEYLTSSNQRIVSESDWALEGLQSWAETMRGSFGGKGHLKHRFGSSDIVAWCSSHDEYKDCQQLTNARRLGRYIQQHRYLVAETAGIAPCGTQHGSALFRLVK